MTEYERGMTFRVADRMHPLAGRTGTLEFDVAGTGWLLIDGHTYAVRLEKLELVEGRTAA
jgi:hypothetical protein